MYTEFGKALRRLRLDHDEVLKHMAERLDISTAYLSAIEVGRRGIPNDFIERLTLAYSLSPEAVQELERAKTAALKQATINLGDASFSKKDTAVLFARMFDNIDEQTMAKIRKFIVRSTGRE